MHSQSGKLSPHKIGASPRDERLRARTLFRFRCVFGFFLLALILSGITAFPLEHELDWLVSVRGLTQIAPSEVHNGLDFWILTVRNGLRETYANYPWVAYGTDWLAFAHFVIAIFFMARSSTQCGMFGHSGLA
jgi:hypothetical protein